MARYIDAEELCRRLNECWHTNDIDKGRLIQSVIDRVITPIVVGTPTADVEEVKHGEFEANLIKPWNGVVVNWKCSVCEGISSENINYCPHCGAKMGVTDTNVGGK